MIDAPGYTTRWPGSPAARIPAAAEQHLPSAVVYTGGAMLVHTPNALPMFKDDEALVDHRKRRRDDRKDPLKSQKPEFVKGGPRGLGGHLAVNHQQALLATLQGTATPRKDGGADAMRTARARRAAPAEHSSRQAAARWRELAAHG